MGDTIGPPAPQAHGVVGPLKGLPESVIRFTVCRLVELSFHGCERPVGHECN